MPSRDCKNASPRIALAFAQRERAQPPHLSERPQRLVVDHGVVEDEGFEGQGCELLQGCCIEDGCQVPDVELAQLREARQQAQILDPDRSARVGSRGQGQGGMVGEGRVVRYEFGAVEHDALLDARSEFGALQRLLQDARRGVAE